MTESHPANARGFSRAGAIGWVAPPLLACQM